MNFDVAFSFLKKLSKNNNREWFEKNKSSFLEIKSDFESFVADLLEGMIAFDDSLSGLDPKKLVFRIYRDIRFSKDKTPYKTNLAAGFSSIGKAMTKPHYYLQIEPGDKSFVALGFYMPPVEQLAKIRQEIDYNGDRLEKIVKEKNFKKYYGKLWDEDALKTSPKGYDKDHPYKDWLKLKSFIAIHYFTDEEVKNKSFGKKLLEVMKAGKPLNDFLTDAIA
jgi:uncharacterized protein (TIGR02453 family)